MTIWLATLIETEEFYHSIISIDLNATDLNKTAT